MMEELQEVKDELQMWKNMVKWVASALYITEGEDDVDIGHEMLRCIGNLRHELGNAKARIRSAQDILGNG